MFDLAVKMLPLILCFFVFVTADCDIYESYTGEIISDELLEYFVKENLTGICMNKFDSCGDGNEWRRMDGSCNNLKYPSRGAFHTPHIRFVEANFGEDYEPRLTSTGEKFKLARNIKNRFLKMGYTLNDIFTQAIVYFLEFLFADQGSIHDIVNYVLQTQNCCKEEGKSNPMCIPQEIASDDPVFRFSEHRCLNFTRPLTFQNLGCIADGSVPSRIDYATPFFDLSSIYQFLDGIHTKIRKYSGGELKTETMNGYEFPSDGSTTCTLADAIKTGCTRDVLNTITSSHVYSSLFWGLHNRFARKLSNINPCWCDETVFQCARDITISFYQHMTLQVYEILLGAENLSNRNITNNSTGYRYTYDESVEPAIILETHNGNRWFHILVNGDQHRYDIDGNRLEDVPTVDFALRIQDLAINNTFQEIVYGMHRQPCAAFDNTVHPDMTTRGLGHQQNVSDILSLDLARGRYDGLGNYLAYRDRCSGYTKTHTTFEDISDVIGPENLALLKTIYANASDVELPVALWAENLAEGAYVPHTLLCILLEQLEIIVKSDRYFYDNANRPHAYSLAQLQEIKKASLARLLCLTVDIKYVQPNAFQVIGEGNELVTCDEIPDLDLTLWADTSCTSSTDEK